MDVDIWWLAYPVLGVVVGFFAGLLGVGGGGIMVPMLTTFFLAQDFPHDQVVHMALGTSMAAIVLTSVSSLRAHHAHGAVRWDVVRRITPGILAGTFGATFIAANFPRAYIDPNRLLADIDPELLDAPWPGEVATGPKTQLGVGLICAPSILAEHSGKVAIGGAVLVLVFWLHNRATYNEAKADAAASK